MYIQNFATRFLFTLVLVFLFHYQCLEAKSYPPVNPYEFNRLYLDGDIPFGVVEDIFQDRLGFIWIAAKDGLYRYDGSEYKIYLFDHNDSTSLSNNVVRKIFGDSKGNMWVITEFGLNLYIENQDAFHRFFSSSANTNSISGDIVTGIDEDRKGIIWLTLAQAGICSYNKVTEKFTRYTDEQTGIKGDNIISLYIDDEDYIWCGTRGQGIYSFKMGEKSMHFAPGKREGETVFGSDILSITQGPDGKIWMGTDGNGISCYDKITGKFNYFLKGQEPNSLGGNIIQSFTTDSHNNLWICTDDGGLCKYQQNTGNFIVFQKDVDDKFHISADAVRCFFEDNAGNFWIGFFNAPINYINTHPNSFVTLRYDNTSNHSLPNYQVLSLLVDHNGIVWIGTDGGGLNQYNPETNQFKKYLSSSTNINSPNNNKPYSLAEDKYGDIWIGFYDGGLCRFDPKQERFFRYSNQLGKPSPRGKHIWDLLSDGDSLWIASDKGVDILTISTNTFTYLPVNDQNNKGTNNESCWSLLKDSRGRIYVGTIDGLNIYLPEKHRFEYFKHQLKNPKSISDKWVYSLFEDSKHRIWVGTNGGGLNLWQPNDSSFINFTTREGLAGNSVLQILEDEKGLLWISTNNGLTQFNPDSLTFRNFDQTDGIQGRRFSKNAGFKCAEGKLYFGGTQGLTYFNPADIKKNKFIPPVYITGFKIFNRLVQCHTKGSQQNCNIVLQNKIEIPFSNKVFTLVFSALNYNRPNKNQYRWRLEPFEKNWNEAGTMNEATYTGLPPGNYIFKVQASNDDKVWNPLGCNLQIIIKPPFYRTYWFIGLMTIILFVLIYLGFRLWNRLINIDKHRLAQLVYERTSELEDKNSEILRQNLEIIQQRDLATSQRDFIKKQNAELELNRSELTTRITERTHELNIAKEKAEQSDQMKTAFLENLSHEIRTPLNSILGFVNLLTEKNNDELSRNYYLKIINESGKNLLRLIDDIIDFSKIQSGQLKPEYTSFSVHELFKELVGPYRDRLGREKQEINILLQLPDEPVHLFSDSHRIKQILSKLLENSIQFTSQGYIRLGIKEANSQYLTLFVEDTGIAIDPSESELVFEQFLKVEGDNSQHMFRGSGLGLALAKQLTLYLKGNIWVENIGEKGLTFCFKIPFIDGTSLNTIFISNTQKTNYYWPGKTVLVVEDEESNFLLIEAFFRNTGVKMLKATDGVEFLEIIESGVKIDLVLLDIKMPRMSGLNAIKIIRDSKNVIPVIMQTAFDNQYHREKSLEMGCDDFLTKPLRKDVLLRTVRKYLENTSVPPTYDSFS